MDGSAGFGIMAEYEKEKRMDFTTSQGNAQAAAGSLAGQIGSLQQLQQNNKSIDRDPQISREFDNLVRELAFQREMAIQLQERLTPVMVCVPPDANKAEVGPEPSCPMAAVLLRQTDAVRGTTAILSSILRRLEL